MLNKDIVIIDNLRELKFTGYDFINSHRHGSIGGLFLDSNLDFKLHKDFNDLNIELVESLFVEILNPKGKGIYHWNNL